MPCSRFNIMAQTAAVPSRIVVADGTLEALKWLALILMTLDHVNTYLFERALPGAFQAGRLAMPLFSFVIAYNLARPDALQRGLVGRTMTRLAFFGLLATPFYIGLGKLAHGWWPLNIMFTFLVAAGTISLLQRGGAANVVAAAVLFLVGGALVDYSWFGLFFFLAAWWYCKAPGNLPLAFLLFAAALLYVINQNFWALAAMPIILSALRLRLSAPRIRYAFYLYYPMHLGVLLILSRYV